MADRSGFFQKNGRRFAAVREQALDDGRRRRAIGRELAGDRGPRLAIDIIEHVQSDLFELTNLVGRVMVLHHEEIGRHAQKHGTQVEVVAAAERSETPQGVGNVIIARHRCRLAIRGVSKDTLSATR